MGLMSVKLHRVCREEEEEENLRCGGRKRVEEWITALDEPTECKKGNSSENGAAPGGRVPSAVLPDGELPVLLERRRFWDFGVGRVQEVDVLAQETTVGFVSMGVVDIGNRNVWRCFVGFGFSHGW
ncbi:hypothetical protein ACFX13_037464 [Malus domestica]